MFGKYSLKSQGDSLYPAHAAGADSDLDALSDDLFEKMWQVEATESYDQEKSHKKIPWFTLCIWMTGHL